MRRRSIRRRPDDKLVVDLLDATHTPDGRNDVIHTIRRGLAANGDLAVVSGYLDRPCPVYAMPQLGPDTSDELIVVERIAGRQAPAQLGDPALGPVLHVVRALNELASRHS